MSILEDCLREDLNEHVPRRIAVLEPLKVIIDNYPENGEEECFAPNHPQKPEWGKRVVPLSKIIYIERKILWRHRQRAISAFPRYGSTAALRLYYKMR